MDEVVKSKRSVRFNRVVKAVIDLMWDEGDDVGKEVLETAIAEIARREMLETDKEESEYRDRIYWDKKNGTFDFMDDDDDDDIDDIDD